jgi:hypothetical protein
MRDTPLLVVRILIAVIIGFAGVTVHLNYINGRISKNESQTIFFLKGISRAQAQVQAAGAIDLNHDGCGEYGFIGEMMGTMGIRGAAQRIGTPSLLNPDLKPVGQGIYQLKGYYIRVYLPGADGNSCVEPDSQDKGEPTRVDTTLATTHWWAHAWPVEHGTTGDRCFYASSAGDILYTRSKDGQYSGLDRRPAANALTAPGSSSPPPWGCVVRRPARDGMRWHVV